MALPPRYWTESIIQLDKSSYRFLLTGRGRPRQTMDWLGEYGRGSTLSSSGAQDAWCALWLSCLSQPLSKELLPNIRGPRVSQT